MKLFNLLKNKAGKLVMGTTQLTVLTVGAAGLLSSAMYKVGTSQGEQLAPRSISSVVNTYGYEGLNRRADGMLTSMNIQNRAGRQGVAVGADRERLEGTASNNDFGLTAADNLEHKFSAPGIGSAARISSSDGLGTGGVDMTEIPAGVRTGTPGSSGVPPVSVPFRAPAAPTAVATPPAATGGNSGGRLAPASMARASGNPFNASSGSAGGGVSGGTAGRRNAPSRPEGYNFSGVMPGGSNVVSSYEASLNGRGKGAKFLPVGRNATVGPGGRTVNESDDLKRISKMSADVAKDRNRGTVAGARPFLANTITTAGMTFDSGEEPTPTGSTDLVPPEPRNLKPIDDWGKKQDEIDQKRANDRKQLIKLLISAFFTTLVAIPLGYALISNGKGKGVAGAFMIAAGCAVIAAAMAVAMWAIVAAGKFASTWGGGLLSTLAGIMGGVCTAALGLTIAAAFANKESPLRTKFFDKIMPKARKLAISQIVAKGTQMVGNKITEDMQNDQKGQKS